MTHTFLVTVNIDDGFFDPVAEAGDIQEDLTNAGHRVTDCKMWTAPTLASPSPTQTLFPTGENQPPTL